MLLSIEKVAEAGWFQWFDLQTETLYPECHVLIFRIDDDYYHAEILDFCWGAPGNSSREAFDSVQEIALLNFEEFVSSNGKIEYPSMPAEYWDEFRKRTLKRKLNNLLKNPHFFFD